MKLFIFDWSKTLAFDNVVSSKDISTLQRLKKEGHKIAIVTLRTIGQIKNFIDPSLVDFYITHNGAIIYDNSMNIIHTLPLEKNIIDNIPKEYQKCFYSIDDAFTVSHNEFDVITSRNEFPLTCVKPLHDEQLYLIGLLSNKTIKHFLNDNVHYDFWKEDHSKCCITNKLASKQNSLKWLCNYLGISHDSSIAFGDGPNDIEMLNFAGKGLLMPDSYSAFGKSVKINTSVVDENSISALIAHFIDLAH